MDSPSRDRSDELIVLAEIHLQFGSALEQFHGLYQLQILLEIAREQKEMNRIYMLLDCYIGQSDCLFEECNAGFSRVRQAIYKNVGEQNAGLPQ